VEIDTPVFSVVWDMWLGLRWKWWQQTIPKRK